MIVEAIVRFFVNMASWVIDLFPNLTAPSMTGFADSVTDVRIWQWAAWANHYLPLDVAVVLLGVRLAWWGALQVFEAVVWLGSKMHILGGGSN